MKSNRNEGEVLITFSERAGVTSRLNRVCLYIVDCAVGGTYIPPLVLNDARALLDYLDNKDSALMQPRTVRRT